MGVKQLWYSVQFPSRQPEYIKTAGHLEITGETSWGFTQDASPRQRQRVLSAVEELAPEGYEGLQIPLVNGCVALEGSFVSSNMAGTPH